MQVLLSRHFFWFTLTVVGVAISSVGCRSTRDSLSTLPGMGWVGPRDEASFSSLASEGEEEPMLPPPSREATPQVVSSDQPSKAAPSTKQYPDTGFPSPIAPRNAPTANLPGSVAGSDSALGSYARPSSATDTAGVGATQRGFYGEQYQEDRSSSVAGGNAGYEPPTGAYDSLGGDGRNSATRPSTSGWGNSGPSDGLSASESADLPPSSSPYQQIRDGLRDDWRNTRSAVSDSAEQVTQQAQGFVQGTSEEVRQGVDSLRDGVRSQYQDFSRGIAGQGDPVRQDPADRLQDSPQAPRSDATRAIGALNASPSDPTMRNEATAEEAYPTRSEPSLPGYGTAGTLNPPSVDRSSPSSFDGHSNEPAGMRSSEPWRPGSTSEYPQSPVAPNGASSGMSPRPYVEPASYDNWGADLEPVPTNGWSSQSQRLSPTYR